MRENKSKRKFSNFAVKERKNYTNNAYGIMEFMNLGFQIHILCFKPYENTIRIKRYKKRMNMKDEDTKIIFWQEWAKLREGWPEIDGAQN